MEMLVKVSEQYTSKWPGSKCKGLFKEFNLQIIFTDRKFSYVSNSRENQGEEFVMEKQTDFVIC